MGMGHVASLIVMAGMFAAPALAQEIPSPPPETQQASPAPDATPPPRRELRTLQPAAPCVSPRGRMVQEPDRPKANPPTILPPKPYMVEPVPQDGRVCPAAPKI